MWVEISSHTNVKLWGVMLCSLVDVYVHLRGTCIFSIRQEAGSFSKTSTTLCAVISITLWYSFLTSTFNVIKTEKLEMGWPLENFMVGYGYRCRRIKKYLTEKLTIVHLAQSSPFFLTVTNLCQWKDSLAWLNEYYKLLKKQ